MNPDLMNALITAAIALLSLVTLAVTSVAIPWIKARTNADQVKVAATLADHAVAAVEQQTGTGAMSSSLKKEQAIAYVRKLAAGRGINLTTEQAAILIESSVGALNQIQAALEPTPAVAAVKQSSRPRDPKTGQFLKDGDA